MVSYRDLFEVTLSYTEFVRQKSLNLHQYVKNVSASGAGVEHEVRQLLRGVLPARFKVTSGYVVSADNRVDEPSVSPQVDIIIVDTLVPHTLWMLDTEQAIEMVPREAVVGIIEVKRTLNADSVFDATRHVRDIVSAVAVRKDDDTAYLPGGAEVGLGLQGPYRSNPVLGIIGLVAADDFAAAPAQVTTKAITRASNESGDVAMLDFVLAFSGTFAAISDERTGRYDVTVVRPPGEPVRPMVAESCDRRGTGGRVALAHGFGYLQAYLGQICGRVMNVENYYFNESIK